MYDAAALLCPSTYARLCPFLTLPAASSGGEGAPAAAAAAAAPPPLPPPPPPPLPPSIPPAPTVTEGLAARGFSRITALELWGAEALPRVREVLARLSAGVSALAAAGLPPLLILAFDEAWCLQEAVHAAITRAALPGHTVALNDWAVFHVPPGGGAAGWPPHRDRPGTSGRDAVDGATRLPRYVTCWLPLTPATPETSCLHFLPRDADPGFDGPNPPPGECPLAAAVTAPAHFQRLVALPAAPGALLAFGSRTLHYGSAPLPPLPSAPPKAPRQALSFALAEEGFEAPAWRRGGAPGRAQPLRARVALAAAQAIIYAEQAPLAEGAVEGLLGAFLEGAGGGAFEEAYAARVTAAGRWLRFKEKRRGAGGAGGGGRGPPSEADVMLAFAAHAAAGQGLDAAAYV